MSKLDSSGLFLSCNKNLTSEVLKAINMLADEGMTMILVTHEIKFAQAASRQTIFIDEGVIPEQGESMELLNNPKKERTRAFLQKVLREEEQEKRERSA